MAASALGGAFTIKAVPPCLNSENAVYASLNLKKYGCLQTSASIRSYLRQERAFYTTQLGLPQRSTSSFSIKCSSAQTENKLAAVSEKKESLNLVNQPVPSSEVESLLASICDTTSIAEFKLNLGGFHLHVKRDLGGNGPYYGSPITPPVHAETSSQVPESNGSANTTSLALSKREPSAGGLQQFLNAAAEEGLILIRSPKVGVFKRCRTRKGKVLPAPCEEKQVVKERQVLCFIEQLGGQIPVESDASGEVIKILRQDGEPVGYGDPLIAILPSFPGIKKLQLPA